MSIRLAVFDCDGTLSDGQAAVCKAMDIAFAEAGLPAPDRHQVRRMVGLSLPHAIARLAPDAGDETQMIALQSYKHAFRSARLDGSLHEPLFDGIEQLLASLHGAGWALGVATGKSDRGLQSTLATHGISGFFSTLQTADRHPSKPHPAMLEQAMADAMAEPRSTVMIGDTVFDVEMAQSAGARAIGVAWGYHEPEELLAAGAEGVAETAAQLEEMLNG
ncbi:phosphoglycolate phosphatase [Altererythrobacter atlanticus]|uniref:Pyrophosphatase PpaX n=1 Tax=Croceibacterium atlanticum TaxID=1267766 RepID=A0A0F7KUL1_9SPHN|nr:Pyrophosphatase PpaX [Croceibacterium atlanticum]MBB5731247.1 phosphoglycolate phosphatase [Croceibacterium atlanticum]